MAFAPTPTRNNAPSQLLPISSIISASGGSSGNSGSGLSASVTISSPPTATEVGAVLSIAGTVSPSGSAVQVGLSTSASTAPTSWTPAEVKATGWTAGITPNAAGTFYIWAQETDATSLQAVSAVLTIAAGTSVAFSSPPSTGTSGTALAIAGTVSPSGSAVQVGLSTSATAAPSSWTAASVSGGSWTATITPSAAGTFYLWAEQTGNLSVQTISAAVVVTTGGAALTYSLITGSGNGSLTSTTLSNTSYLTADWTSVIEHGATDVAPNVAPSSIGSIAACKFWFDTSATNTTVPSSGYGNNASINNGVISFYPASYFSMPTGVPAAPATAGTYHGKYAMYDSSGDLLGVYVTSAIGVV